MKLAYKNIGTVTKEFYGVKFKPGDTKIVDNYINSPSFVRVDIGSCTDKSAKKGVVVTDNKSSKTAAEPKTDKPAESDKSAEPSKPADSK